MSREQRVLRARIATHARWAKCTDRTAATQAARDALAASWLKKADPEGKLGPEERAQRAEHLKQAHFLRMALKSAQSRAKR